MNFWCAALIFQAMVETNSTWFKLFIAIVSMAIGLFTFKLIFAWHNSPFLTPFYSFLTLVAISIGIYALATFAIRKLRGTNASPTP